MDELELRRRCYAQPDDTDPAFRAQLAEQPVAAGVARAVARFDQRLRFALNQAPVPEGLAGRVMLQIGMERRKRRQRRFALFAVAASLLLSLGLGLRPTSPASEFNELALQHVHDELAHLNYQGRVPPSEVNRLLGAMGGELQTELGDVRFAAFCPTPQGQGLHLVMDGKRGPVTVLYVPGATNLAQREHFDDHRFVGVSLGTSARGRLAVIGEQGEAVDAIADQLNQSIRWPNSLALART